MTTFGWKRKVGGNVLKNPSINISEESDENESNQNLLWVQSFKRKKQCLQENCNIKYEECKAAGIKYAEKRRYVLKLYYYSLFVY